MAPVSNAEGGGRLMLSKGIDAECVKAVYVCVCVCVESFRTLGASQCATKSGTVEQPVPRFSTRTTCLRISPSLFLSLFLERLAWLSLSFGNFT